MSKPTHICYNCYSDQIELTDRFVNGNGQLVLRFRCAYCGATHEVVTCAKTERMQFDWYKDAQARFVELGPVIEKKYSKALIDACIAVIDELNDHETYYEIISRYKADGLTIQEAETLNYALDHIVSRCHYYFQGCGEEKQNDLVPYDLVEYLQTYMDLN